MTLVQTSSIVVILCFYRSPEKVITVPKYAWAGRHNGNYTPTSIPYSKYCLSGFKSTSMKFSNVYTPCIIRR